MEEGRRHAYLEAMEIPIWLRRDRKSDDRGALPPVAEEANAATDDVSWQALQHEVSRCEKCALYETRTQTVFGVGNASADWLVIGEAPGADEDRLGEPFVGRAGKLLDAMLKAIDLDRASTVYISNILKCRPPNNRDPLPDEVASCSDYLRRQISHIRPKIILAVGRIAAQNLLQSSMALSKMRGVVHRYPGTQIPVVVTYHPAYLLRSPSEKRGAWEDLKFAVSVFRDQASAN